MKLEEIAEALEGEVLSGGNDPDLDITVACSSDLMSDVLAFVHTGALLLTGLTNPQVIRTAEMADLAAVCFVRGKRPDPNTVELAKEGGSPLLRTELPLFESSGKLYARGLIGCSEEAQAR